MVFIFRSLYAVAARCSRFCIMLLVAALQAGNMGTAQEGRPSTPEADRDHRVSHSKQSQQSAGSGTIAQLLRLCADALSQEGAWKKAEQFYESALTLDRQAENHFAESLDLAGIGHSEVRLGYPLKAEDYYQEAFAIQQKISPNSLAIARSLNGLGQAMIMYGDVAKAEQYFHQAQTILTTLGHAGDLDFAISLNGLGNSAQLRGYLSKAETYHRQALSIQKRLSPRAMDIADTLDFFHAE